jgi:hypothetical protein
MANTEELKNAMSATRTVTKLFDNQEEHATRSDDEPLSRTDRFFITSMLADEYPSPVSLSEDTIIGGSSLGSIMELGRCELYNDLKLQGLFDSLHIAHLVDLQTTAWDCFNEVQKNKADLHARDFNLRYALKAADAFIQHYDRLESRWAQQYPLPSGERVLVPLTPNSLINGATLRQIMEWCRVDLYLKLKPQNPFEAILADLFVRTHKAGWHCFEQADWWRHRSDVRELSLKYNLKAIDTSARLLGRLERYRTKHERVLHNSATGGNRGEVAPSRFHRHSKKQDKARLHVNGNGRHA